jgi:pantoate kinase
MQRAIEAFSPGDISCLFQVVADPDPERMHSLGLSFTVEEGVTARVTKSTQRSVRFNNSSFPFPTIETLLDILATEPISVELTSPLPLSCGFGLSAACALATSYAVNELCNLGLTKYQLALKAHVAEVKNLTGLGDVCIQYNGGCCGRFAPGRPLEAVSINVPDQPIYFRHFSALNTSEVLRSEERKVAINHAAKSALSDIENLLSSNKENSVINFGEIVNISLTFAKESGLLLDRQVKELIDSIRVDGGYTSMIMLGNAVFSLKPFPNATKTFLRNHSARLL